MFRPGNASQALRTRLHPSFIGGGLMIAALIFGGCPPASGGGGAVECRTYEKRCADDIVQVCGEYGTWVSTTSCNVAAGERCLNGACESTQPDPIAEAVCGNGRCESGENAVNCADCRPKSVCGDGRCDMALGETAASCPTDCKPSATCGDGKKEGAEGCDLNDFGSQSCITMGLKGGSLACNDNCTLDLSGCSLGDEVVCGDGVVSSAEDCDGAELNGQTCADFGHTSGTLKCNSNCTLDYSGCATAPPIVCGDGSIGNGEECDGANLAGESCTSKGFKAGALTCLANCTFDTSGCNNTVPTVCGNGKIEANEECDGAELANKTCITQGFTAGTIKCAPACKLDTSGCTNPAPPAPTTSTLESLGNGVEIIDSASKSSGDTYIVGEFLGTSVSVGGKLLSGQAGSYTSFVAKLNLAGVASWAKVISSRPSALALSSVNDVYVLREGASDSLVLQRFSASSGAAVSSTEITSSGTIAGASVISSAAAVYVAGRFSGVASAGSKVTLSAGSADDILVARFNWDLTSVKWLKSYGSTGADEATDLALDLSNQSLVMTGKFSGTVKGCTSQGDTDIFLATLDIADGKTKTFGCHGSPSYDEGLKIVQAPDGKTYLMGYHNAPATIVDPMSSYFNKSLAGSGYFLARFDLEVGILFWAENTPGFTGRALGVNASSEALLCGQSGLNVAARSYTKSGKLGDSETMKTTAHSACRGISYAAGKFRAVGNYSGTLSLADKELSAPMTSGFFWSFE